MTRLAALVPLLGIEQLKARRHPVFLAAFGLFVALVAAQCWWISDTARSAGGVAPLTLPESWRRLVYLARMPAVFFAPATVVLLTAGEFSLRTARQQVADGLSRTQFFAAKLLLVLWVAALYWLLSVSLGFAFGVPATPRSVMPGGLLRLQDVQLLGAYYAALVGYGTLGLFLSFALRSTGSALGALVFHTVAVDGLIGSLLAVHDRYVVVARRLPTRVFDALMNPARYEPGTFDAVTARFAADDVPFPELPSTAAAYATAGAWVILFLVATYLMCARRDL